MEKKLDLDTLIEIINNFLEKNLVQMVITMPEGTQEPEIEDNTGLGPVVQHFIAVAAFKKTLDNLFDDGKMHGMFEPAQKGKLLRTVLDYVYKCCMDDEGGNH